MVGLRSTSAFAAKNGRIVSFQGANLARDNRHCRHYDCIEAGHSLPYPLLPGAAGMQGFDIKCGGDFPSALDARANRVIVKVPLQQ